MLLGVSLSQLLLLAAGGAAGLAAILVGRRWPKAALLGWIASICFVPFWAGLSLGSYFQPGSLAGIVVVIAYATIARFRAQPADVVITIFFVSCVLPLVVGGGTRSSVFGAVAIWLVAYLVGRLAPTILPTGWIQAAIALILATVAFLAVIEFVADWHPFRDIGPANSLKANWSRIQVRGGVARSEWAFGHSIALGSTLASAIPLAAAATRLRTAVRAVLIAILIAGVLVTVSRVSMVCAALGLTLVVVFGSRLMDRAMRTVLIVMGMVGVLAAVPFVGGILGEAGDEATGSAAYRGDLLDLLADFAPLGMSPGMQVSPNGTVYFNGFQSIDSQLIFTGLTYGTVPLLLGLVLLIAAAFSVVLRHASAATIAVVAQIPSLAVVSLITQYSLWFWFIVGLSVAMQVARARDVPSADPLVVPGRGPLVR